MTPFFCVDLNGFLYGMKITYEVAYSFGFRKIFYSMIQSVQWEFSNQLEKPTTQLNLNSMTFQYGQKSQTFIGKLDLLQNRLIDNFGHV